MKIPEGVSLEVLEGKYVAKGPKGSVEKAFNSSVASIEVSGGEAEVKPRKGLPKRRSATAALNSIRAHVRNALEGAATGFSKKLVVVFAHFPITVEVKGSDVLIKNFLGEKSARKAAVLAGVQVKVDKQEISVTGADRYAVGQTAANIIQATRISERDRRIFQDGIYVSE